MHQLGTIAQHQGEYEQARSLYQQSLAIAERVGNQNAQAITLYQLGLLAYEQGHFEYALRHIIQAHILFEALQSPSRALAQDMIARIRGQIDEETFLNCWQAIAGDRPLIAAVE